MDLSQSTYKSLADSLQAELNNTSEEYLPKCRIYRVPGLLRSGNEDAYTPKMVSIGPYHHQDERLRPIESHKLEYLKVFLSRYRHKNVLNLCLETLKNQETEIRQSYTDQIPLSSDDFTKMVLIDSVFIIELFLRHNYAQPDRESTNLFGQVLIDELLRDLLLLENQLPLFVLNKIYDTAENNSRAVQSEFNRIVLAFFNVNKYTTANRTRYVGEPWHLLDLVRENYIPPSESAPNAPMLLIRKGTYTVSPTATILHEAGIKFKVSGYDDSATLGMHFDQKHKTLHIPKLRAWDTSHSLFRNMVAFEQCTYNFRGNTYVTNYHYFLDCLINTPEDVQLLADAKIIDNCLGNDVLCDSFNGISKNSRCMWSSYQYKDLCKELNEHCMRDWNRYKATLKNRYFAHPWAAMSLFYAILLLFLTIVQVMTGIMAVPGVRPEPNNH